MLGFKQIKWNSMINLIVLLIIGILLLLFPIKSLEIASYLIASLLMLSGFAYIIRVIKNKGIETNGDLISIVLSIAAIAISITIFIDPTWIIRAINVVIGLVVIINSIMNIVNLLKFRKDKTTSWWVFLSFTITIILLGIFTIINPEFLAKIIVQLEGATLVVDTILTMILSYKVNKLLKEKNVVVAREVSITQKETD